MLGLTILYCLCMLNFSLATENDKHIIKMNFYLEKNEFQKAYNEMVYINFDAVPKDKRALLYNKAGFIYYKLNRINEALNNYYKALRLNPELYFVYNNIGVIFFSLKNYEKAKEYYLKAYEKNKNYPKVLVNLAIVNFYLKNFAEAYNWFKKALFCNRDYIQQRFNRKKVLQKLRELVKQNPDDKELKKILKWAENNKKNMELLY